MEDVLDLYAEPHDPKRAVVCFDETSKQLVAEKRFPIPAKRGAVGALEIERNQAEAIINWRFSTGDARNKLQHIYPPVLS